MEFVCQSCGGTFDTPKIAFEPHPELEDKMPECCYVCPFCGENEIEEARFCGLCGEPVIGDYVELNDGRLVCNGCFTYYKK